MYFPNADVVIHPALLALLGLIVGTLGGFFGVGGGFLITGGLLVFGVPPVYAVGTGLTLVMGTAIINTFKHRRLGNVDFRLGALMVAGTIPAIFLAEWVNSSLEAAGIAGPVIRYIYVAFLSSLGLFILYDYRRTRRAPRNSPAAAAGQPDADRRDEVTSTAAAAGEKQDAGRHDEVTSTASAVGEKQDADRHDEVTSTAALARRVRSLRIPPHRIGIPGIGGIPTYIALPVSGIERISVFVPAGIGFAIGFIAGLLGAGGGFILMPTLIYVLGIPTTIAIGTDLFQIIITGSVGTFAYALSDRVDPLMAALMLAAASAGSQLGAAATRRVEPSRIRFLYGLLILSGGAAVALEEISQAITTAAFLSPIASVALLGSGGGICLALLALALRGRER